MSNTNDFRCPKCGSQILLKWAKSQGVQCKHCYNWISNKDLSQIVSSEGDGKGRPMEIDPASQVYLCNICGTPLDANKSEDGGVICTRCYNWIKLENAEIVDKSQLEEHHIESLKDMTVQEEVPKEIIEEIAQDMTYVIGEKIDNRGPSRKIQVAVNAAESVDVPNPFEDLISGYEQEEPSEDESSVKIKFEDVDVPRQSAVGLSLDSDESEILVKGNESESEPEKEQEIVVSAPEVERPARKFTPRAKTTDKPTWTSKVPKPAMDPEKRKKAESVFIARKFDISGISKKKGIEPRKGSGSLGKP